MTLFQRPSRLGRYLARLDPFCGSIYTISSPTNHGRTQKLGTVFGLQTNGIELYAIGTLDGYCVQPMNLIHPCKRNCRS
ncbi:hypothetical protein SPHINGO391_390042 [Sphingomonas aurantiaca]|uniref:Uncharacterized protein n=1 Tax=Sphingomonas aurantiaca TaxID=185949 RepID=A0A5E7YKC0_9SPHN|nr:hypothetical protein SPHINGO391_390042 [Sphingomonas aurantiaca]